MKEHTRGYHAGNEPLEANSGDSVWLRGFSYLIVSQVSSRAVTFALNLVITRMLSPEAYGLASVQFHLINTVILFLSREGFRRGCLRIPQGTGNAVDTARHTLTTAALCIPVGLAVTCVTCWLALSWTVAAMPAATHRAAVGIQGVAAMLELLSEPLYILAAVQLKFRLRAIADTAAIIAKLAIVVALLKLTSLPPALALSIGQVAFAAMTIGCYSAHYAKDVPIWLGLQQTRSTSAGNTGNTGGTGPPRCDSAQAGSSPPAAAHHNSCRINPTQGQSSSFATRRLAVGDAPNDQPNGICTAENGIVIGVAGLGMQLNRGEGLRHRGVAAALPVCTQLEKQLLQTPAQQLTQPQVSTATQQAQQAQHAKQAKHAQHAQHAQQSDTLSQPVQLPRPAPLLHRPTLWLCGTFSLQAAEKLVLAEGSKMVMIAQPPAAQGVYGLVTNLGALVVRTAFQPFEEAAFTAFSTSTDRYQDARLLVVLVRCAAIVGLLAASFGPANAWLALRVLYSQRWSSTAAPLVLAAYCPYLLLMAVNGILEAFVHAVADSRQLIVANVALVVFAGSHMALSAALVHRAGALGLIAADCVNMAIRIVFSLLLTHRLLRHRRAFSLRQLLPGSAAVGASAAALCATGASAVLTLGAEAAGPVAWPLQYARALVQGGSEQPASMHVMQGVNFWLQAGAQVAIGSCCLLCVLVVVYHSERATWSFLGTLRRQPGTKRD